MRLKLGFFSDANVRENGPEVSPKVRVRLTLGCGLNKGFYGRLICYLYISLTLGLIAIAKQRQCLVEYSLFCNQTHHSLRVYEQKVPDSSLVHPTQYVLAG